MSQEIQIQYFKSSIGELILGSFENKLCLCDWKYRKMRPSIEKRIQTGLNAVYKEKTSPIIEQTKIALQEYLNGERSSFEQDIMFVGTDFQKSVWNKLLEIPYGKTESYLGLSKSLSNEKAIRAVGSAYGANAISILVPCHRIIGSDGNLVGYAGGLSAKKKLLSLEKSVLDNQLQLF